MPGTGTPSRNRFPPPARASRPALDPEAAPASGHRSGACRGRSASCTLRNIAQIPAAPRCPSRDASSNQAARKSDGVCRLASNDRRTSPADAIASMQVMCALPLGWGEMAKRRWRRDVSGRARSPGRGHQTSLGPQFAAIRRPPPRGERLRPDRRTTESRQSEQCLEPLDHSVALMVLWQQRWPRLFDR